MDPHAQQVLEFGQIRTALSEHVHSRLGLAHVESLTPSTDRAQVGERLIETGECCIHLEAHGRLPLGGLEDCLESVRDAAAGGVLRPEELLHIARSLDAMRRLRECVSARSQEYPRLAAIAAPIGAHPELVARIDHCVGQRSEVLDRASPMLGQLRSGIRVLRGRLTQRLESVLRNPAYRLMIQDPVIVERSGRGCVPIKSECRSQFPGLIHDQSASGQTVFMEPTAALETSNEIRRAELDEEAEVQRILSELSAEVGANAEGIRRGQLQAGILDFIHARALYARELNAAAPRIADRGELRLRAARHPLLTGEVVPLDIQMNDSCRTIVITGPNTGGKTVALKTVGLLSCMAQSGLHVPAVEAVLPVFSDIFADIGDEQSIAQSLSTFSSHVTHIVRIVRALRPGCLVLLDELGAGTDPVEGAALASALIEHFTSCDARTILTTHYGELKELAYRVPGVVNASVQFEEETLAPTYELRMGVPGRSLALVVSTRLGMPEVIVEAARCRVSSEEQSASEMLRELEKERQETAVVRKMAEEALEEAEKLRTRRERDLRDLEKRRRDLLDKAAVQSQEIVRRAQEETKEILAEIRRKVSQPRVPAHAATEKLASMDREISEVRKKLSGTPLPSPTHFEPRIGTPVHVPRFGQRGTIVDGAPDGDVMVALGSMRLRIPVSELQPSGPMPTRVQKSSGHHLQMEKAASVPPELKLIGLRAEAAITELDRYLDDSLMANHQQVRVIHGRGTGALRNAVWEWLRGHHAVESYRIGAEGEGGSGATIVELVKS